MINGGQIKFGFELEELRSFCKGKKKNSIRCPFAVFIVGYSLVYILLSVLFFIEDL